MQAVLKNINRKVTGITSKQQVKLKPTDDYADVLKEFGLKYKRTDYYLEVGEPRWVQGWILDVSVIQTQFITLFETVIPILINEDIPFKIARSSRKAHAMIGGELGPSLLGKVLTIYPHDEKQGVDLAKRLIQLTHNFKGPEIVTDRKLGGVIYTRYGAGMPVIRTDEAGVEEQFIYNTHGALVRDIQKMPFKLPDGIKWPFGSITPLKTVRQDTVLQDRYKPLFVLKDDPKGTVRKGLWLKKTYQIKWCVIKQGKQNMVSDMEGRSVVDRLNWQYELHKDLFGAVPLPEIYDYFVENGDGYLVMEYIRGTPLHKRIEAGFKENVWSNLPLTERQTLLNYALQVLDVIETMHVKGYIHRDVTSNNFLVNKHNQLWMIDMELSYSIPLKKPSPPFRLGTLGHISPEQEEALVPTVKQDIYAIGAVLVELLTGLPPYEFAQQDKLVIKQQLPFFISDLELIDLIGNCFSIDPKERPTIVALRNRIKAFHDKQMKMPAHVIGTGNDDGLQKQIIKTFISRALHGLANPELLNRDGLWISKGSVNNGFYSNMLKPIALNESLFEGISGIIWLLAEAFKLGFPIESCRESYDKSVTFLQNNTTKVSEGTLAGLYSGTAGLAMAFAAGIDSELIPNKEQAKAKAISWLANKNVKGSGIVKGLAGKGIALLKVASVMGDAFIRPLLDEMIIKLLEQQEKDGSWSASTDNSDKKIKPTGFGHGVAGIACFLLCYLTQYGDDKEVRVSAKRAMQWLVAQAKQKQNRTRWSLNSKTKLCALDFQDGCMGVMLSMIKAYQLFRDIQYRDLAEQCLLNYARNAINRDLTLSTGFAGYGEVLLEGAKAFNGGQWQERADWIANFIIHYFKQTKDGARYWTADGSEYPTAGLLVGNSGVIHFMLRYYQPWVLNHPLLSC